MCHGRAEMNDRLANGQLYVYVWTERLKQSFDEDYVIYRQIDKNILCVMHKAPSTGKLNGLNLTIGDALITHLLGKLLLKANFFFAFQYSHIQVN